MPYIDTERCESLALTDLYETFNILALSNSANSSYLFLRDSAQQQLLVAATNRSFAGRCLHAEAAPYAEKPIERLGNCAFIEALGAPFIMYNPEVRQHPATQRPYIKSEFFSTPKHCTGVFEAIDVARLSLVLKPVKRRLAPSSRYWVRVVNNAGDPLVHLSLK